MGVYNFCRHMPVCERRATTNGMSVSSYYNLPPSRWFRLGVLVIQCRPSFLPLCQAQRTYSLQNIICTGTSIKVRQYHNTLPCPHIPHGIHMEWIYSMWNPWNPHGIHMEYVSPLNHVLTEMDSTWYLCSFHMEST